MINELNISVAGAAGQGLQTIGFILGKIFVRGGCQVFAGQEIQSRIRGGHNVFQLRVGDKPVNTLSMPLDLLIALDQESIDRHLSEVSPKGLILFDSETGHSGENDDRFLGLPLEQLALEKGGRTLYSNSVALGAVMAILGWDLKLLEDFLGDYFSAKPAAAEGNIKAARAGFEYAAEKASAYQGPRLEACASSGKMFISGHEAVALGALAAGCRFMSAYPMSPATGIMVYLAGKADELGLVVEQAEDEIAAANMAIGASWAGVRSMTATSGGGFSLMVEALGLAGITETPLVIVNGQRPGPSTGMATKTEQADLLFTLHAGQDEFPRAIFAPGTARQAFFDTIKAFDLAEKYQIPVIILTEHYLANAYFTEDRFDISDLEINRHLMDDKEAAALTEYKRYRLTPSGISPRLVPGAWPVEVGADSHEHDEFGHISEKAEMRTAQMEKRFRKVEPLIRDMDPPMVMGDPQADLVLVGWGGVYGSLEEAVQILIDEGTPVMGLYLTGIWPFPGDAMEEALKNKSKWAVVEANYTGQLTRLIQTELCRQPDAVIKKYTGRPFTSQEIAQSFKKEVLGR